MVRTAVLEKLRMRQQKTNRTLPLDVLTERRTERFKYQSPGSEGE